jgi:hypothetical protein
MFSEKRLNEHRHITMRDNNPSTRSKFRLPSLRQTLAGIPHQFLVSLYEILGGSSFRL